MTIAISITCDECGLTEQTSTDMESGVNEIEASLEEGWTHDGSEDYCPACPPKAN